jgi:CRISPR-associated endonuclease/helicase Cas3
MSNPIIAPLARPGQTLLAHSVGVGERMACHSPLPNWGQLVGLLHDYGKYRPEWVAGMQQIDAGGTAQLPHHALEGGLYLLRQIPQATILALLIASHHTGLPNTEDAREKLGRALDDGKWSIDQEYQSAVKAALSTATLEALGDWLNTDPLHRAQRLRMMFGALILSDRQDAAQWQSPPQSTIAQLSQRLSDWYQAQYGPAEGLNGLRWAFYQQCRSAASQPPGWLSVRGPCGISKTWSVMQLALDHAATHGKQRVIYCVPWTAILEQSYALYRERLGEAVLGHWSTLVDTDTRRRDQVANARQWWDAPVIATTMVQLFDILLGSKGRTAQRMPALQDAVIVLDEVQGLPIELLSTCIAVLNQLVEDHGATVILSTATMPDYSILGIKPIECIPNAVDYFGAPALNRVAYEFPDPPLGCDAMADAIERSGKQSTLIVTNTVAACNDCHQTMSALPEYVVCKYTASMTPAHRSVLLAEIKQAINQAGAGGPKVIICATSAIETGVDLDCQQGYRELTGLDSIVQFGGRINRNSGSDTPCPVIVFRTVDRYNQPPGSQTRITATTRAIALGVDLQSPEVLASYSNWLLQDVENQPRTRTELWTKKTPRPENFDFKGELGRLNWEKVSKEWQMIAPTNSVLVDPRFWDAPSPTIATYDQAMIGSNYRVLQQHCISLHNGKYQKAKDAGMIAKPSDKHQMPQLREGAYDRLQGLSPIS